MIPFFSTKLQTIIENIILESDKKKHPIGSLEFNTSGTNPANYFGFGTWTAWGSGRVPVGVNTSDNDFKTVEKTGGEKTHKLTINEMPKHRHKPEKTGAFIINNQHTDAAQGSGWYRPDDTVGYTNYQGGDQAHNNLQPYITCYMWKRTA